MLQNDFFSFSALQTEGNEITTNIKFNASHPIFEGHFPGEPVVPGACMMQMVKEVLENHLNKQTRLVRALDLKFLSFIHPVDNKMIELKLKFNFEEELIRIDARLLDGAIVLFKFKGIFIQR